MDWQELFDLFLFARQTVSVFRLTARIMLAVVVMLLCYAFFDRSKTLLSTIIAAVLALLLSVFMFAFPTGLSV